MTWNPVASIDGALVARPWPATKVAGADIALD